MSHKQSQNGSFLSALENTPGYVGQWDLSPIGVKLDDIKPRWTYAIGERDIDNLQRITAWLFLKAQRAVKQDKNLYEQLLNECVADMARARIDEESVFGQSLTYRDCCQPTLTFSEKLYDELHKNLDRYTSQAPIRPSYRSHKDACAAISARLKELGHQLHRYYSIIERSVILSEESSTCFCVACHSDKDGHAGFRVLTYIQVPKYRTMNGAVAYCHEVGHALHAHKSGQVSLDFMVAETVAYVFTLLLMEAIGATNQSWWFLITQDEALSRMKYHLKSREQYVAGVYVAYETAYKIFWKIKEDAIYLERFLSVVSLENMDYPTMIKMLDLTYAEKYLKM